MNPILLKPNGNGTSQVVLHGRVWKTLAPRDYYAAFDVLIGEVLAAYADLARRFDVIVIEGAGSVSELNLRAHDLVNLGLVTRIGAPWVLVADIERGGVFASVVGTVALLTPDERRAVPRLPDQQVPRRPDAVRRRPRLPRGAHRRALPRRVPLRRGRPPRRRGQPGRRSPPAPRGAGGRGHRDRAAAADVERDRLPSAGLGGLDDGAAAGRTPLRLRGAARHQGHARRSRLARAAGPRRVGACPARRRRHDRRHLRRLSDARRDDRRSRRGRIDRRRRRRARPAAGADRARGGEAHPRGAGDDRRRGVMPGLRDPHGRDHGARRRSRRSPCSTTARATAPAPPA